MSKPDLSAFRKGQCINSLPFSPEQREVFDAVMEEDILEFPNAKALRVVNNDWGISLRKTMLQSHRAKECSCYRKETK
jgi:hypothetical protein